jgi:hypothetical protein
MPVSEMFFLFYFFSSWTKQHMFPLRSCAPYQFIVSQFLIHSFSLLCEGESGGLFSLLASTILNFGRRGCWRDTSGEKKGDLLPVPSVFWGWAPMDYVAVASLAPAPAAAHRTLLAVLHFLQHLVPKVLSSQQRLLGSSSSNNFLKWFHSRVPLMRHLPGHGFLTSPENPANSLLCHHRPFSALQ